VALTAALKALLTAAQGAGSARQSYDGVGSASAVEASIPHAACLFLPPE
jgi:hypothetical protein